MDDHLRAKNALDRKRFRRKYLLNLATAPSVFVPAIGGLSTLFAAWGLGLPGVVPFLGFVTAAIGLAMFATKFLSGDEKLAKSALSDLEAELENERARALDDLALRLAEDDDPRDEQLLSDLRRLSREFHRVDFWPEALTSTSTFDLMTGIETLFDGCVVSLERQVRLVDIANKMTTQEARGPLEAERERILNEVKACISQLGSIYASVQQLGRVESRPADLAQVRGELDRSLQVAARVQDRMRQWDADTERRQRV